MKSYEEIADSILEKYSKYLKEEKKSASSKTETEEFADTVEYKTEIITRPQRIRRAIWNSCAAVLCLTTAVAMLKLINNTPPMIEDNAPEIIDDVNIPNNHSIQMTTEKYNGTNPQRTEKDNKIVFAEKTEVSEYIVLVESENEMNTEYEDPEISEIITVSNNKPHATTTVENIKTTVPLSTTVSITNTTDGTTSTDMGHSEKSENEYLKGYTYLYNVSEFYPISADRTYNNGQLYVNDQCSEFVVSYKLCDRIIFKRADGISVEQLSKALFRMDDENSECGYVSYEFECIAMDTYMIERSTNGNVTLADAEKICYELKSCGFIDSLKFEEDIDKYDYFYFYPELLFSYPIYFKGELEAYIKDNNIDAEIEEYENKRAVKLIINDSLSGTEKANLANDIAKNAAFPYRGFEVDYKINSKITDVFAECDAEIGDNDFSKINEKTEELKKRRDEILNVAKFILTDRGLLTPEEFGDDELRLCDLIVLEDNRDMSVAHYLDYYKGDANCDKTTTIADAVAVLQNLANSSKYPVTEQGVINADFDGDGLTALDALEIQKMDATKTIS